MTGKLLEKLPGTMNTLMNQLPDNLYPEEIPNSLNIFSSSSDSVAHYNQMAAGKRRGGEENGEKGGGAVGRGGGRCG